MPAVEDRGPQKRKNSLDSRFTINHIANLILMSTYPQKPAYENSVAHYRNSEAEDKNTMPMGTVLTGVFYMLLIAVTMPLHVIIVVIILRNKEFRKLPAYGIMVNMSASECILMSGHFMGGLMSACQTTFHPIVPTIGGSIVSPSWIGLALFTLILSLNRFLIFTGFKMTKRSERRLFSIICGIVWPTLFLISGIHFLPKLNCSYDINLGIYLVQEEQPKFIMNTERLTVFVSLAAAFLLCMATVVTIVVKRNMYSTQFKVRPGEIKMFIQSVVIFSYLTLIRIAFNFGPYSGVASTMLGMATQAVGLLNPVLYLLFNGSIRTSFFAPCGACKTTVKVVAHSTNTSKN
uniref:G_PROTEIN_RECEP_F1_2 domain-containing protein n=1 Tax=Steinernema glaseri TaxID=37863 RepID=A0A1I7ZAU6_9BILA